MFTHNDVDALVVGAGPVGMMTALSLAERGLNAQIIDEEWRTAAHSYACALHPRTLRLLKLLALADDAVALGERMDTVGFYDGTRRRAEVRLSALPGEFPFLLVLPQSEFEGLLERTLRERWNLDVLWNHRLSDFTASPGGILATVDRLEGTATGHIVPRWELVVKKTIETRAAYLVGADGHQSWVRQRLGLEYERVGEPEVFVVYEFESDATAARELQVILHQETTNVLWPLPGGKWRLSCQWTADQLASEFPAKNRSPVRFYDEAADRKGRHRLERLLGERAPWFRGSSGEIHWSLRVRFNRQYLRACGSERCWLVGDAAHQTGPVGIQSLNVGLCEAEDLARRLATVIHEGEPAAALSTYETERRAEWSRLLGADGNLKSQGNAEPWVTANAARILPCLPASGEDLDRLLLQLGLAFG